MKEKEKMKEKIKEKVLKGERLSKNELLLLFNLELKELGELAQIMRFRLNPERIVTYVVDRNINYTNGCISKCKFCAFYKDPEEAFVLTFDELAKKIEETLALGGYQILLQGGLNPKIPFSYYEKMLRFIKKNYPQIHIHAFSPPEILFFSKQTGLSIKEVLKILIDAGLDSIPGGGAEILSDRVRKLLSPKKGTSQEWLEVMEQAHKLGLKTTATMMFGHIETQEEIVDHLLKIRDLQDKTQGFTAFIPWTFQPGNTELSHIIKAGAVYYLKVLAISRLALDNIKNIQVSWVTQGPYIAQIALEFGGNDFGSTMIEENVVAAAGVSHRLSEEEIRHYITSAGYVPKKRRMDYTIIE